MITKNLNAWFAVAVVVLMGCPAEPAPTSPADSSIAGDTAATDAVPTPDGDGGLPFDAADAAEFVADAEPIDATCPTVINCTGAASAMTPSCAAVGLGQSYRTCEVSRTLGKAVDAAQQWPRSAKLYWYTCPDAWAPDESAAKCVAAVDASNVCVLWCFAGPAAGYVLAAKDKCLCPGPAFSGYWNGTW